MSDERDSIGIAYIGPNAAHREFRIALANAKSLAYILVVDDKAVLRHFLDEVEKINRQSAGGAFAIGLASERCTTSSVQFAICITKNKIELMYKWSQGFISQAVGLVYREVSRVFETYLVDLFDEIAIRRMEILYSGQTLTHQEALEALGPAEIQRLVFEKRKAELTRVGFTGLEKVF